MNSYRSKGRKPYVSSVRELDRLELLLEQIRTVEAERYAVIVAQATDAKPAPLQMLLAVKGVGAEFAVTLWSEGFFRHFDDRRQIAVYAGLAPTPWQRGAVDREQGESRQHKSADDFDSDVMVMAAASTELCAGPVVQ